MAFLFGVCQVRPSVRTLWQKTGLSSRPGAPGSLLQQQESMMSDLGRGDGEGDAPVCAFLVHSSITGAVVCIADSCASGGPGECMVTRRLATFLWLGLLSSFSFPDLFPNPSVRCPWSARWLPVSPFS